MHLTSKWHRGAGSSLGRLGDGASILGTKNFVLLRQGGRGLHDPEVLKRGTMGHASTVRQGRGRNSDTNTSPHLIGADQSWHLHTLNGPA